MTPWFEVFVTIGAAVIIGIIGAVVANLPIRKKEKP